MQNSVDKKGRVHMRPMQKGVGGGGAWVNKVTLPGKYPVNFITDGRERRFSPPDGWPVLSKTRMLKNKVNMRHRKRTPMTGELAESGQKHAEF